MQKHAFIKDSLTMAIIQIIGCPDLGAYDNDNRTYHQIKLKKNEIASYLR